MLLDKASVAERPKAADSCVIRFLGVKGYINSYLYIQYKLTKILRIV